MAIITAASHVPSRGINNIYSDEFASDDDEEVDAEDAEPWHIYSLQNNPRVLYPICLGQVLHERYLIEHKLGHRGLSTI